MQQVDKIANIFIRDDHLLISNGLLFQIAF